MTPALDHIQLAMPAGAEPAARAFWCDIIGLAEIDKPEALKSRGGVWLQLAGAELHLGVEPGFSPARKAHPGFRIPGIDALADRLTAAGYPAHWDAEIAGRRRFFTEDPFGNRLEFLEDQRP